MGAYLNLRIKAADLTDRNAAAGFVDRGAVIRQQALGRERRVLALVDEKLSG